jgi:hypothetical protein
LYSVPLSNGRPSRGDPDTTENGDGSFDHEFASGGEDLPSYTLEVGMPKVPAFFRHAGVKLNSIALEFTRSGAAAATINAIAQGETRFGTTQGGTPTSLIFSRISQFHVWTAPALQEPFEHADGSSRLQPCIRPLIAAFGRWP